MCCSDKFIIPKNYCECIKNVLSVVIFEKCNASVFICTYGEDLKRTHFCLLNSGCLKLSAEDQWSCERSSDIKHGYVISIRKYMYNINANIIQAIENLYNLRPEVQFRSMAVLETGSKQLLGLNKDAFSP